MSDSALLDSVLSLLKRLDAAVADKAPIVDVRTPLEGLDTLAVTLPVLSRSKCGVIVSKLRTHSDATVATLAGALVRKWKRVAEEAGVGAAKKPDASPAAASALLSPASVASSTAASSSSTAASAALKRTASQGAGSVAGDAPGTTASSVLPSPLLGSSSRGNGSGGKGAAASSARTLAPPSAAALAPPLPPLPPARSKPRQIFVDMFAKVVREQTAAALAATATDGGEGTPPPIIFGLNGPDESQASLSAEQQAIAAARQAATQLEAALFSVYGGPLPERPATAYSERFRALAMALPRNAPLALNVLSGLLPWADVVQLGEKDLVSEAAKESAALMRRQA